MIYLTKQQRKTLKLIKAHGGPSNQNEMLLTIYADILKRRANANYITSGARRFKGY